jgi:hypothetical protein
LKNCFDLFDRGLIVGAFYNFRRPVNPAGAVYKIDPVFAHDWLALCCRFRGI